MNTAPITVLKRLALCLTLCLPLQALSQEAPKELPRELPRQLPEKENPQQLPPQAEDQSLGMTNDKIEAILKRLNPETEGENGRWTISFEGYTAQVITDQNANRMRIIIPVIESEKIDEELMYRLMQANFGSALDARYGIAQGVVWSTFIHPLAELTEEQFVSGLAQTIVLTQTFGTSFSSGALHYGGGDHAKKSQKLFEDIYKKGLVI